MLGFVLARVISAMRRTPVVGEPVVRAPAEATAAWTPEGRPGIHLSKTIAHRIKARVEQGGLTISVDDQTYHSLDEIPDAATREMLRKTLQEAPAQVTDPAKRAKVEAELESLGIKPDQEA